jgi:hypothetical protein
MSRTHLDDAADRQIEVELARSGTSDREPVGASALGEALDTTGNSPTTEALADGVLLVTPDGGWVRERSREFFVALGDSDPDYDASLFAVKNLGFIVIRVSPESLVEIRLHPRNVSSAALASIQHLLPSVQSDLFRISYLKEGWISETAPSAAQTICRLSEICALEGVGVTRGELSSVVH